MKCLLILFSLVAVLFAGCTSVDKSWVMAAELTYATVAPSHAKYVKADPLLTPKQKKLRLLLLDAWKLRNSEWRKTVGD